MILTKSNRDNVNIEDEFIQKINSGLINEMLILVPTNRKIRDLKKSIITSAPGQTTGKLNLETIGTFSTKLLLKDSEVRGTILSDAAATVLLNQSFQEVKLAYFSGYKSKIPSGTLDRIKNVISEYKKHGITPATLRNEVKKLTGSEKLKAEDIAAIYEKYMEKFTELGVKEIGDIYSQLNLINAEDFKIRFRELYPLVNLTIVHGFDEFTSPEIEILNSASKVERTELFISFDYFAYNQLIFSHLDRCYEKLESRGFREIRDLSQPFHNKFQTSVREKLFKINTEKKISGYENSIIKITAPTREKEVELIAKKTKFLIEDKKVDPDKICIVFNLIQKYSPVIRDLFSVYKIPINLTDRYSLNTSPPVIAILNLLEVLENDYYYRNILRALSGGFLDTVGIQQSNIIRVSSELKIISGYENWKNSIEDALIQKRDEDDNEFGRLAYNEDEYRKALSDIKKLHILLSPFDKQLTIGEFVECLAGLVFKLNIPIKLVETGDGRIEENVKAVTTFIETVTDLMELFRLEYGDEKKFPLKFFLNHIRTGVNSSRYNIKERHGFGVQITTLGEIRGLSFDYLFISGMCDGDFPTRYSPEIFFSPSYAKDEQRHQTEERYHFYQSLCSWRKGLYFTLPQHDEKKELVESNFLTGFTKLFTVSEKTENDFESEIYSKEELLVEIGKGNINTTEYKLLLEDEMINVDNLNNAVSINKQRLNDPFGASEFSGVIAKNISSAARQTLDELKFTEYSISQLETYAKCPYKYFAERILKLKPVEEPVEEIEALEMGTLLHSIFFEFYTNINKKGIYLFNCSDKDFKFVYDLIFTIAEDKISKANFHSPVSFFEKEKVIGINGAKENSILFKFLTAERNSEEGFSPEYFETGFGSIPNETGAKASVCDISVNGIKVRGKIDRIDINNDKNQFKVVDYKLSGKTPGISDLLEGISLQLSLYMYAAKKIIQAQLNKEYAPSSADIYSLKFTDKDFGRKKIKNLVTSRRNIPENEYIQGNEDLIKICIEAIEKYVRQITEGKFNLTQLKDRDNKVCNHCNFKSICRIQTVN